MTIQKETAHRVFLAVFFIIIGIIAILHGFREGKPSGWHETNGIVIKRSRCGYNSVHIYKYKYSVKNVEYQGETRCMGTKRRKGLVWDINAKKKLFYNPHSPNQSKISDPNGGYVFFKVLGFVILITLLLGLIINTLIFFGIVPYATDQKEPKSEDE